MNQSTSHVPTLPEAMARWELAATAAWNETYRERCGGSPDPDKKARLLAAVEEARVLCEATANSTPL